MNTPLSQIDPLVRRIGLVVAALVVASVAAGACSLPADDRVNQIGAEELGPELANTTTTSTTTTTTLPATTTPPVSIDPSFSQPTTTTTTAAPLPTRPVSLYYTIGSTENMQQLDLELLAPVSLNLVQQALESPRPEVRQQELQSAVVPGLIDDYRFERAVLSVILDGTTFQNMTDTQRRRAIGQMVLTYTSFTTPDRGGIGFVQFLIDGSPISVVLPSTQSASDPGVPIAFDDFRPLLSSIDGDPPESTVSTTPPTSAETTETSATSTEPP